MPLSQIPIFWNSSDPNKRADGSYDFIVTCHTIGGNQQPVLLGTANVWIRNRDCGAVIAEAIQQISNGLAPEIAKPDMSLVKLQ